ncbi:MAG: hypothetical protein ACWA45_10370 [Flavobacteriales bacterium]
MKFLFKKTVTIFFLAALLFACHDDDDDNNQDASVCDEGDPTTLITNQTAFEMQQLYLNNQYAYINEALSSDGISREDNTEIIFDIDELEKYICYIRNGAADLGLSNLGIRVYLGAKYDDEQVPKTTVFFMGTYQEGDGRLPDEDLDITDLQPLNLGDPGKGRFNP